MINIKYLKHIETIIFMILGIILLLFIFSLTKTIMLMNINIISNFELIHIVKAAMYLLLITFFSVSLKYVHKQEKSNSIKSITSHIEIVMNKHKIITWVSSFIIFFIIFGSVLVNVQNSLIYFPPHDNSMEESLSDNNKYEKLNIIINENTVYSGWVKINQTDNIKTVLYFGGNAQSSASFFNYYDINGWGYLDNYNVIVIDYPGYGLSTGSPQEDVILEMSLNVFDYVSQLDYVDSDQLIVMGYSLGTGVASYISEQRDFLKLVLVAPYSSMTDVIKSNLPIAFAPFQLLIKNKYNTLLRTEDMNEEILIIASNDDEVIDIKFTMKLINELPESEIHIINGYSHNNVLNNKVTSGYIESFIN